MWCSVSEVTAAVCLDVRREKNVSALTQTWTLDIRRYRKLACFYLQLLFPERSAEVVAVCDGAALLFVHGSFVPFVVL